MRQSCTAALILAMTAVIGSPGVAGQTATTGRPAPAARADIDKLPVSLARIRRELARETSGEEQRFENFRLLTSLNVYGRGADIEFFTQLEDETFESLPGAVRYGGVTHSEFLAQVQPKNLPYGNARPPVANLSGNLLSLANWAGDKRKEAQRKKEEEARKRRIQATQERPER